MTALFDPTCVPKGGRPPLARDSVDGLTESDFVRAAKIDRLLG